MGQHADDALDEALDDWPDEFDQNGHTQADYDEAARVEKEHREEI